MKVHVTEIDITKLTKTVGNLVGRAVGVEDILMPYLPKLQPQLVVGIGEYDYEVLLGKERADIVAELYELIWRTKIDWAAELFARRHGMKYALVIYGAWNTLIVFI